MRTWFVLPAVLLALSTLTTATTEAPVTGVSPVGIGGPDARVVRIRAHFDSVLAELSSRDVSTLSSAHRTERAALLQTLGAYRDRGLFPRNYDFPSAAVPYFVDRRTGILCAVAHLLAATGRRDLVDRVAAADNNVWVMQLAGDKEFAGWLDAHGLLLSEAARIQVPYMSDVNPIVSAFGSRDNTYLAGVSVAAATSVATALWNARGNADGHRTLGTVLGFTTGLLSLGLGGAALTDPAAPRYAAPVSLLSGGLTAFLSTRGMLRHRGQLAARKDADRVRSVARVSVSPLVPLGSRASGLAISVTF